MSDTAYKIKVMQALEDGKAIQMRSACGDGGGWFSYMPGEPLWHWGAFEYRIKPEPLELWVNVLPSCPGEGFAPASIAHQKKEDAIRAGSGSYLPTLFRQVLDSDAE